MSQAKQILLNLKHLLKQKLEGIDIKIPNNYDNITEIFATIHGPTQTPFDNGAFDLRIKLTDDYPKQPPKAYFITKVFHPNVEPKTGEVCVRFGRWPYFLSLQFFFAV